MPIDSLTSVDTSHTNRNTTLATSTRLNLHVLLAILLNKVKVASRAALSDLTSLYQVKSQNSMVTVFSLANYIQLKQQNVNPNLSHIIGQFM